MKHRNVCDAGKHEIVSSFSVNFCQRCELDSSYCSKCLITELLDVVYSWQSAKVIGKQDVKDEFSDKELLSTNDAVGQEVAKEILLIKELYLASYSANKEDFISMFGESRGEDLFSKFSKNFNLFSLFCLEMTNEEIEVSLRYLHSKKE